MKGSAALRRSIAGGLVQGKARIAAALLRRPCRRVACAARRRLFQDHDLLLEGREIEIVVCLVDDLDCVPAPRGRVRRGDLYSCRNRAGTSSC